MPVKNRFRTTACRTEGCTGVEEALSTFTPSHVTLDPPAGPDHLAGAVLKGLSRPIGAKLSWSVVRSLVLGLLSFGVLPIVSWVRSFRAYAVAEQQQYLHLAQWVRLNTDHPLGRRLEEDAKELRPRAMLTLATVMAVLVTVVQVGLGIDRSHAAVWDSLLWGTYGYGGNDLVARVAHVSARLGPWERIHRIWVIGLAAAYALHWLQLQLHAQDVRRFVGRFNEVARAEGVPAARVERLGPAVRPLWLAAGVAMWAWGAPWGVVAMLAGAAQRRYITWSSRGTRAEVAQRLRTMVLRRRPAAGVPVPVYLRERCVEKMCRAEIPRGVNFCPRCGTRQKGAKVDVRV